MEFQQIDNSYMVYVEKEEKVMDTLTNFCIDHNIHSCLLYTSDAADE